MEARTGGVWKLDGIWEIELMEYGSSSCWYRSLSWWDMKACGIHKLELVGYGSASRWDMGALAGGM
jgi:hypothetical protein